MKQQIIIQQGIPGRLRRIVIIAVCVLSVFAIGGACGNGDANNKEAKAKDSATVKDKPQGGESQEASGPASGRKTIVYFGNSLTAGYGLPDQNLAFPELLQARIDSLHLQYETVNAGNSGETSSGGLSRIDWVMKQHMDIFVLELGANDGLRGIPLNETEKNLQAIVDKVRAKYPGCKLIMLGMQVPPNLGKTYTDEFRAIFPSLAQKNQMALVPFLLAGVGGVPSLNQGDGIHPNTQGEKIVADNVWTVLKDQL